MVDGFNLYHSIIDIRHDYHGLSTKWLDIHSLCSSYLYLFGKDAVLKDIYYFSAFAYHLHNPDVVKNHKTYIRCLEATGVIVEMGRFKAKEITCPNCNQQIIRHEEKETDVAIAIKLCDVLFSDNCDIVVPITGDTDLAPAIRQSKLLFPTKSIVFAFPYKRKNLELSELAPGSFNIHKQSYVRHQFSNPFPLPDETFIYKPAGW